MFNQMCQWCKSKFKDADYCYDCSGDLIGYHELKTWPEYFDAIVNGTKTFEVRKNDRDFQMGDVLYLREYDPETKTYTGREMEQTVSYILHGPDFGIEDGYCVMAIGRIGSMFTRGDDE